jgi:UDP-GlcNAc:undecaprenyl-phosphate/decaprenyl-phosphate GlcNAc-1-phosphate transferase
MVPIGRYVMTFGVALAATLALTPLAIRVGRRLGIEALPGGRRKHHGRIVRIGGLGLFPALLLAILSTYAVRRTDPGEWYRITGMLLGVGIVWLGGLVDDRYELPGWAQALILLAAALAAIRYDVIIELFNNPFTDQQIKVDWYLMLPISVLWLTGFGMTVNLLDGVDGLATGVTAIASLVLCAHMLRLGQQTVALLPLALLGCCLGFLVFNLPPARVFLGGGAYLLGFALGAMAIIAGAKVATALLVLWVPIVDVAWQMHARWRRGQALAVGDRGHLHFLLVDAGWPTRRVLALYWGVTAALGLSGLLLPSRFLKLVVLVGFGIITIVWLALLARRAEDALGPDA